MFNRRKYKKFARIQLKNRWTVPVLTTLVCGIIICLLELPDFAEFYREYINAMDSIPVEVSEHSFFSNLRSFLTLLVEFVVIFAQLQVFIKMSKSPEPVHASDFINGFNLWARGILSGLWQTLWTFLWSLLFVIPGIVKHYAYNQTKFLVSEYPLLSITQAMRVSIEITRGHKAELFMMDLSFLGWFVLSILTYGIGFLWFIPYRTMTMTNVYHGLLKDAITQGIIKSEDLEG